MAGIPHLSVLRACSAGLSSLPECIYARVENTRDASVRIPVQHPTPVLRQSVPTLLAT